MVSASNIPKGKVSFSLNVLIFSWFGSTIPSVICCFPLLIIFMAQFSMPNSIHISCLYFLSAFIRGSNSFSFLQTVWCRHLVVNLFLIITITNSNGDSASPWNIPFWIFISAKLLPPEVNSTLQFFLVSSMNFVGYLVHFETIYCPVWRDHIVCFLLSIHTIAKFLRLVLFSLSIYWSVYCNSLIPLVPLRHPFSSSGNLLRLISE